MCGRVTYLHVAFLHHIAKVCEKCVNFEWISVQNLDNTADMYCGDNAADTFAVGIMLQTLLLYG